MNAQRRERPGPDEEEQYRLLFDANPCPMLIFDENTLRFLDVNRAALQLYGWSREAFLQMTTKDIRPPEDVPRLLQTLERSRGAQTVSVGEWHHVARDGRVLDVEVTVSSIRYGGQEARLVLVNDIGERKRAEAALRASEAALRESEERYRALFEQAADAIVVFDPQSLGVLDFNDEACRHLGWTRAEFAQLTIPDFEVSESPAETRRHCQQILRAGGGAFETQQRRKDGVVLDIEVRAKPIRIGEHVLIQGTWRNITERRRAEEALRESQAALQESHAQLEQRVAERTKTLQMLHDVTTMANESQNPEQAIEYCLHRLALHNEWCFGHALLPAADDPEELVPADAWYAANPERFRRFREVTFALRLRRGQGLPGRVFARGKLEWTTDLPRDLIERRACVAEELGLGTAVACPVLLGDKVAAVLEFFSDRVLEPDGRIAEAMLSVGLQLSRVIERAAFEEHLLTIAEDVQRGLAQDLHDDVGQELTGLGLKAATLADMLAPAVTPPGKLAANIASALERTHDKVRRLGRGMLPIELEEGLLAGALEQLAAATSESSRMGCEFTCPHPDPVFDSRVAMHLYRIAQEAIANAVRHSRASRIHLALAQEHGATVLRIEDNGAGLARDRASVEGMGLRTMRYRASLIGGKLEVGPNPSGGTQVVCRLAEPPAPDKGCGAKSTRRPTR